MAVARLDPLDDPDAVLLLQRLRDHEAIRNGPGRR
jgi:hypothetical protein